MEWQTLFSVRASFDGAMLDSCISWQRIENVAKVLNAAKVAARLEGTAPSEALAGVSPDASQACHALQYMNMRSRFNNNNIEGPYLVTSEGEEAPCDEVLLDWWKRNRNERFMG